MPEEPPITAEEESYFRRIEERFCALRGAPMLLSPRDWALIAEWWSRGIPLCLVLESLEEVFAARTRRGDPSESVNSLTYTRHAVQRRWTLQRELTSPRGEEEGTLRLRAAIRRHWGRVARGLKEAGRAARRGGREELARTLLSVAADIGALRKRATTGSPAPASAWTDLDRWDSEVLVAARRALGEAERIQVEQEVEALLAPRRQAMKPEIYLETRSAIEGRLIRRHFGIPRLSLLSDD